MSGGDHSSQPEGAPRVAGALYERIYAAVRLVPPGVVSTYGDIAAVVGDCDARTVGYALNDIPKRGAADVPWQRIVNREGAISTRGARQRDLLVAEGVTFDDHDRVPMTRHRWPGPDPDEAAALGLQPVLLSPPAQGPHETADGTDQQLPLF